MVGRRDPRRRVSVSQTTAERAKINAVGRNRVTVAVARVARPYHRVTAAERVGFLAHGGARSLDDWGRGGGTRLREGHGADEEVGKERVTAEFEVNRLTGEAVGVVGERRIEQKRTGSFDGEIAE